MLGWSWQSGQRKRLAQSRINDWLETTYEHFEDVDLVDERRVVLHFLLLDGLDGKLLMTFTVLGQVDDTETSIGQFLLERVHLFNVSLRGVDEILGLILGRGTSSCRTDAALSDLSLCHCLEK